MSKNAKNPIFTSDPAPKTVFSLCIVVYLKWSLPIFIIPLRCFAATRSNVTSLTQPPALPVKLAQKARSESSHAHKVPCESRRSRSRSPHRRDTSATRSKSPPEHVAPKKARSSQSRSSYIYYIDVMFIKFNFNSIADRVTAMNYVSSNQWQQKPLVVTKDNHSSYVTLGHHDTRVERRTCLATCTRFAASRRFRQPTKLVSRAVILFSQAIGKMYRGRFNIWSAWVSGASFEPLW